MSRGPVGAAQRGALDGVGRLVLIAALVIIAASEWSRVFGWGVVGAPVMIAALAPVALVYIMGRWLRRSAAVSLAVSLVLLYWFLAVGVLHTTVLSVLPSFETFAGVYRGIVDGWAQILSVPLPSTGPLDMLVLPCTVVWLAGALGAELALRKKLAMASLAPPVVALLVALPFGVGSGTAGLGGVGRTLPVLAFIALMLAFIAIAAAPVAQAAKKDHRKVATRRTLEASVVTLLVCAAALIIGPSIPVLASGHPYNPRAGWIPPTAPAQAINPLDELSKWAAEKPRTLFTVRSSSPLPPSFQLAYLPTYSDLLGWSDTSRFERIGSQVPAGAPGVASGAGKEPTVEITQSFSIGKLPGPWLPEDGRPSQVQGVRALADPRTGILVAASGSASGTSYTLRSATPASTPNCSAYDVVAGPTLTLPPQVEQLAQRLTQGAATPCEQALALENAMRNTSYFTFDATAPSGTNIQVMEHFLYGANAGARRGTSEQFASGFALLAESLGLPARVYIGFHSGANLGQDRWQVTTRDAYAGAEIDFAGLGWVPFDPTRRPGNVPPPPDERVKGHSSAITGPLPGGGQQNYVQAPVPHVKVASKLSSVAVAGIAVGVLAGLVLVLLALIAGLVALVRSRRRKRRRGALSAKDRTIGAWLESIDEISALGVRRDGSRTAEELVLVGARALGAEPEADLEPMAQMVNAAMFSKWEPDDDAALEAWRHADSVSETARCALGRRGRIIRAIDIRTLFRR